jgi:hypothetical protein
MSFQKEQILTSNKNLKFLIFYSISKNKKFLLFFLIRWQLKIFLNPTKALVIIIISTICMLLILAIAILYLHR